MNEGPGKKMSLRDERAERLAAKLRENLRRRKAQARALSPAESDSGRTESLPNPRADG